MNPCAPSLPQGGVARIGPRGPVVPKAAICRRRADADPDPDPDPDMHMEKDMVEVPLDVLIYATGFDSLAEPPSDGSLTAV